MLENKLIAAAHDAVIRAKGKGHSPTAAEIQEWIDARNRGTIANRRSIFSELKFYCPFSNNLHFIEVTEWANKDGYDIDISANPGGRIQVTHGQFEAMKDLIYKLEKAEEDEQ